VLLGGMTASEQMVRNGKELNECQAAPKSVVTNCLGLSVHPPLSILEGSAENNIDHIHIPARTVGCCTSVKHKVAVEVVRPNFDGLRSLAAGGVVA